MKAILDKLIIEAKAVAQKAYAPYSEFRVGAAVMTASGEIFTGCNVENASYSLTLCAERTAIFKAVSEGHREFVAIGIYVDSDKIFPPCGACRQVLAEFNSQIDIAYANHTDVVYTSLDVLLPGAFKL